jgi:hypothetical protein
LLVGSLDACRREHPEGGAAASDTLDVSARQQVSFEREAAATGAEGGDSSREGPARAPTREESAAAYAACRDSVDTGLTAPSKAYWPTIPDTIAPAEKPGHYRLVAQVRPDSVSPGAPFLCVVRKDPDRWTVVTIQGGPSPPQSKP